MSRTHTDCTGMEKPYNCTALDGPGRPGIAQMKTGSKFKLDNNEYRYNNYPDPRGHINTYQAQFTSEKVLNYKALIANIHRMWRQLDPLTTVSCEFFVAGWQISTIMTVTLSVHPLFTASTASRLQASSYLTSLMEVDLPDSKLVA